MKKNQEVATANSLFGISEEKADEIIKEFAQKRTKSKDVVGLAKSLDVKSLGEQGYKVYLLGRLIEENQQRYSIERVIKGLIERGKN